MNNVGLMKHCYSKIGTSYIYAAKGEKITKAKLDNWFKMYPSYYTETRKTKAIAKIGKNGVDCSGLISWYTGKLLSSTGLYNSAAEKGPICTIPEEVGILVWKQGHVGVYVGNGYVVEAKGIDYGVVETKLSSQKWTHWLRFPMEYVNYTPDIYITRASYPYEIRWLQNALNQQIKSGHINVKLLDVDGKYGALTAAAVLAYFDYKGWNHAGMTGFYAGKSTVKSLA